MTEFVAAKSGETETQWRQFLSHLFAQVSVGKAATGVLTGLAVAQTGTASGSVLIGAGAGVAQASTGDGASPLVNPSQVTLDIFTANPVGGTPRNDVVVFDAATATIRVITGTPNAVPTDPTVPTSAVALARLRHAASATTIPTAKIDDLRAYTNLSGVRTAGTIYRRTTDYVLTGSAESPVLATVAPPVTGTGTLKVTCFVPAIYSTVLNDRVKVFLKDGSGAACGGGFVMCNTGAGAASTFVGYIIGTIPAGDITMTAQRVAGTGDVTLRGVEGWTLGASIL